MAQATFERYEKKYLLQPEQKKALEARLKGRICEGEYGRYTVSNIYYDTADWRLVRMSLDKPAYKEKLRMRAYGMPRPSDTVFVELKKKYDHVVFKRRISMELTRAERYLSGGGCVGMHSQILSEIDSFLDFYPVFARMMVAYDRAACTGVDDPELRVTFDTGIRYRTDLLGLSLGSFGTPVLDGNEALMEIKCLGAEPLWLTRILSEEGIFPISFSKYGRAYAKYMRESGTEDQLLCLTAS